jgi:hypothetical protein
MPADLIPVIDGRSLHRKLAQIMYEAERIPKNGTAPAVMGGYKFVQVGDAADYIRKALADQKITMLPTSVQVVGQIDRQTAKGGNMTTVDLLMEWTLTDGDSGESITIMSFGAGADGGDKYSGKASTSAMKYALLTGFLLSTGDDTEAHTLPEQTPGRAAPGRLPPRVDPATVDPAPSEEPYVETEELIGRESRRGIIRKGSAEGYKLDGRIGPEGHVIGFRLETGKGNIPQCIVAGPLGELLYLATAEHPDVLKGVPSTVAGILYYVKTNRDTTWYRLHVDRIETTINGLDVILPADEPVLPEPPADVPLTGEATTEELGLLV